ncbi:unnamed protein product [Mycena citricolor]|nr:unnamed protein product [Mycena citricolor]
MSYFQTKNEKVEEDIVVPDVSQVEEDEALEHIGEVMSIIGQVVIVKGRANDIIHRSSAKALDSETLLVFEDRKVLGYVFETFGPTAQPLYQVKFNTSYPLDKEKVQVSRQVFHVPRRSNFVFVEALKRLKGSDASNMHDEEPAADELEFSDDEAEAAYKSSLKRKRESRANSVVSSRQPSPSPTLMRDQDLAAFDRNPYGAHSVYDADFGAGPSRPAPIPYDEDPYSDVYDQPPPGSSTLSASSTLSSRPPSRAEREDGRPIRQRGRTRGSRGRRERGRNGNGGDRQAFRDRPSKYQDGDRPFEPQQYTQPPPRPLSPTSMAIARATGQMPDGSNFQTGGWNQQAPQWSGYSPSPGPGPGFVQPHINPRFAQAFGMAYSHPGSFQQPYYPMQNTAWTGAEEWTVHGTDESNT